MSPNWKPIAESLPELNTHVLVTDGETVVVMQRLPRFGEGWFWSLPDWIGGRDADIEGFDPQKITRWDRMPSP